MEDMLNTEFCKEVGKEPNREFHLSVSYELQKSLEAAAEKAGESLNNFVTKILSDYLAKTA